ncbi:phage tail protein I [Novosphingobium sp.]|uniref:phage tail protein I n=1 Tax=Novosphingobium sp. TaxID=1874826 RepID=UPI001ED77092|nr:phage tail protein I [Novosphingobium sp.]MBK6801655.1 phage tail protein I [Novosphingobium sp.]MBK9009976.1 phage tail protein I [Novosphingobium sp.]
MTSLLPPSSTPLERAVEHLALARLDALPEPLRALWSPQDCPEALLPWLAWALSIDQWSPDWPIEIRRARIAAAIEIQRIKGTRGSVERVVASFGGGVAIREWFEFDTPEDPHTFQLVVALGGGGAAPSAALIDAVIAEVTRAKPARSHFTFALALNAAGIIGTFAAAQPVAATRLSFETQQSS